MRFTKSACAFALCLILSGCYEEAPNRVHSAVKLPYWFDEYCLYGVLYVGTTSSEGSLTVLVTPEGKPKTCAITTRP